MSVNGAEQLKAELEQYVSQEEERLKINVAQYYLTELKKECVSWVKWLDQAVEKKNTKSIEDYSKKFRDCLDKRRAAVQEIEDGQKFLKEMDAHIDKANGLSGDASLSNEADKILETARFKLKWVDQYLNEKKTSQCTDMYNELQKIIIPLKEEKFQKLESVTKFLGDVEVMSARYNKEIGEILADKEIEKESESIKHFIKWLSSELDGQRRVSQVQEYSEKLEKALAPLSSKYADHPTAQSLINEASVLLNKAKEELSTIVVGKESEKILESARFKLKWVEQYLDEKKTTQCKDTFDELQKIIQPLFDSKYINLDSVVQFYSEYERIENRYNTEIGAIILEKELTAKASNIEFYIKCLTQEAESNGNVAKMKDYFGKLQKSIEPIIVFSEHQKAKDLIDQANLALENGAAAIEYVSSLREAEKIIDNAKFKVKTVEQYLQEKQTQKCSAAYQDLLKVMQQLADPKFTKIEIVSQFTPEFDRVNERVKQELGAAIVEKEIVSRSETVKHYIKWLSLTVDAKGSLSATLDYYNKLLKVYEPFEVKFAQESGAVSLIQEAKQAISKASTYIEEVKKQMELQRQKAAEIKQQKELESEQWKQGVNEHNIGAARDRMELAKRRIESDREYYASLRNTVTSAPSSGLSGPSTSVYTSTSVGAGAPLSNTGPLKVVLEKDGLMPVFDANLSDDQLYSPFLSINRSTEQICEKFDDWEEYTAQEFKSKYLTDEHSILSRSEDYFSKINDLIGYALAYAANLKQINGGEEITEMLQERGKNARQIIEQKFNYLKQHIPYSNLVKKAKQQMKQIRDDNDKCSTRLLETVPTRLIGEVMPVIQKAMKLVPENREECEYLVEQYLQLKQQVTNKQEEVGRKIVMKSVEQKDEAEIEKSLKLMQKTCSSEFIQQLEKDIKQRKQEIAEEEKREAERQRIEAEKERLRLEELRKQCEAEWKGKYTTGGKIQNNDYEVWEYTPNGEVRCVSIQTKSDKMDFFWTGSSFAHTNSASPTYHGNGNWNGSSIGWIGPSNETLYSYAWNSGDNKYHCSHSLLSNYMPKDWTWTGTKLVSGYDTWEVLEGQVPHPVILQVAMLKLIKTLTIELEKIREEERRKQKEEEDRRKEEEKKKNKQEGKCNSLDPNEPLYMCHNCSLSKKNKCVKCGGGSAQNDVHMCHNCNISRWQYCYYCRNIVGRDKHQVKACHNCSLGQERCLIKKY
jgi:hypothetical protein